MNLRGMKIKIGQCVRLHPSLQNGINPLIIENTEIHIQIMLTGMLFILGRNLKNHIDTIQNEPLSHPNPQLKNL